LETKPARKNRNSSVLSTTSAVAQDDAQPTDVVIQSTTENESCDQVFIEMNGVQEP